MDLQFIQFSDALLVTAAEEVPVLTPRSLKLTGKDFSDAIKVRMNDIVSPSFVVASNTVIIAQVPDVLSNSSIVTVTVLSSNFTATIRSTLEFSFSDSPRSATGIKAMMQTFLKMLMTDRGSDSFKQTLGGSGLSSIGTTFSRTDTASITGDFATSISRTVAQIRTLQASQTQIPDEERLLSARLISNKLDVEQSALIAKVELVSQSGTSALVNLEL